MGCLEKWRFFERRAAELRFPEAEICILNNRLSLNWNKYCEKMTPYLEQHVTRFPTC